ncbi:MAG: hypothetical protein AB9Q17_02140 [Candidatus Reddybacter sp.]
MSEITASPLTWPPQHPRTNEGDRICGRFLNCFAYPKSYLRMIRDKDVIAVQIGQLHLF